MSRDLQQLNISALLAASQTLDGPSAQATTTDPEVPAPPLAPTAPAASASLPRAPAPPPRAERVRPLHQPSHREVHTSANSVALYLTHQNQLQALPNDRHPWPHSDISSFQRNPTVRQAHTQLIAAPYFGTPVITFNSYAPVSYTHLTLPTICSV